MAAVDFVMDTFERNYRAMTEPGWIAEQAAQHRHSFDQITLVVNNVDDRTDAEERARSLLNLGEIGRYVFVEDSIDHELRRRRIARRSLGRFAHWTDVKLVGTALPGPEFILWWDSDNDLVANDGWVSDSIEFMAARSDVFWLFGFQRGVTVGSRSQLGRPA